MDKEEAMKILKDFHDKSALFSVRTALETLHPELRKSEDEKIRKEIIQSIRDNMVVIHKDECIAWLEKQGESSDKIHYWTEEEIEPIISDYLRGAEHYGGMIGRLRCLKPKSLEKQGTSYTKRDVDDAYLKGISDAKYELEKQGEQKPWSEESEHRIKLLEALCEDKLFESVPNSTMYDEMKITIDWLNSLRPQPKQKWSEEDEKMIGRIRSIIEAYTFSQSAVDVNGELCEKEYIDADNWLKSLKNRIKGE